MLENVTNDFGFFLIGHQVPVFLNESGDTLRNVYFSTDAIISLLYVMESGASAEISVVGNEGLIGIALFMGGESIPSRTIVQSAGYVYELSGQRLKDEFNRHGEMLQLILGVNTATMQGVVQDVGTALRALQLRCELCSSPTLLRTLSRNLYLSMVELSQSADCTHFHKIELRLASCLLMVHDRMHIGHFHLTHAFLASMLGVRRSSITIAAGALQQRKFIRYTRGEILILDRRGLEATSCGCYTAMLVPIAG